MIRASQELASKVPTQKPPPETGRWLSERLVQNVLTLEESLQRFYTGCKNFDIAVIYRRDKRDIPGLFVLHVPVSNGESTGKIQSFSCPQCGCKLISVSSGVRAKPACPKCDYSANGVFVVKDRVANEAMNVIADNTELAENFAETVKREIANDDGSYAHIGFHLANDIRNQSPASEVLLTLCGWNIDTLLDKTPPIAIED